jgi:protein-S-isoprenylcysteine O-methyltransferase Ste14
VRVGRGSFTLALVTRWQNAIPYLLLGVVVAAYWYRVLRMAAKARRRTGRAANLLPPERTGRLVRVMWAPAVVAWVVQPFLVALLPDHPWALRPLWHSAMIAWPAAVEAGLCLLATRACWRHMGAAWRMGIDPAEPTPLMMSGPFARVRHPIYALSAAMMLATVAAVPSPLMFAAAAVHLLLLSWEARREDRHLESRHGDAFRQYRRRVGAFLPRSVQLHEPQPPCRAAGAAAPDAKA